MMLLSPIRLIKIKTFIISRTDQNVVKLHILLILVLTAKAFWEKKIRYFLITSIHITMHSSIQQSHWEIKAWEHEN